MKYKILFLLISSLIISSCQPSETAIQTAVAQTQVSYTPTPSPTETLESSPTPDLLTDYFSPYLDYLQQWSDNFERIRQANKRIAEEGDGILGDDKFREDLASALDDFQTSSKKLSELNPPLLDLQLYKDRADELNTKTEIFTTLYILALSGDQTAMQTAMSALEEAVVVFTEIVEHLEKEKYLSE